MKNWRTAKALYSIVENSKKETTITPMVATGEEVSRLCKAKNEFYGYIPGIGGNKSYQCYAVLERYY